MERRFTDARRKEMGLDGHGVDGWIWVREASLGLGLYLPKLSHGSVAQYNNHIMPPFQVPKASKLDVPRN
jgi:hypothetical protein